MYGLVLDVSWHGVQGLEKIRGYNLFVISMFYENLGFYGITHYAPLWYYLFFLTL
jgi:hypothetical protein